MKLMLAILQYTIAARFPFN